MVQSARYNTGQEIAGKAAFLHKKLREFKNIVHKINYLCRLRS
jgi:hypothetical protein